MKSLSAIALPGRAFAGEDVSFQGRGAPAALARLSAGGRLELRILGPRDEGLLVAAPKGRFLLAAEGEALAALRRSVTPGGSRITLELPRGSPVDATGRVPARLVAVDGRPVDIDISLRPFPTPGSSGDRSPAGPVPEPPDLVSGPSPRQAPGPARPPFEATLLRGDRPAARLAVRLEPAPAANTAGVSPEVPDLAPAAGGRGAASPPPTAANPSPPPSTVPSRGASPPSPASPAGAQTAAPPVPAGSPPPPVAGARPLPTVEPTALRPGVPPPAPPAPPLATDLPPTAVVTGRDAAGRLLLRLSEGAPAGLLRIEEPGLDVPRGSRLLVQVVGRGGRGTVEMGRETVPQPPTVPVAAPPPRIVMTEAGATLRLFAYLLRREAAGSGEPADSPGGRVETQPPVPGRPATGTGVPETGTLVWLAGAGEPLSLRVGARAEGDEGAEEAGQRWVFALELAAYGALRLELWSRGSSRQLTVRSERPLPEDLRRQIADLFGAALEISGNRGWLLFTGLARGANGAADAAGGGILA